MINIDICVNCSLLSSRYPLDASDGIACIANVSGGFTPQVPVTRIWSDSISTGNIDETAHPAGYVVEQGGANAYWNLNVSNLTVAAKMIDETAEPVANLHLDFEVCCQHYTCLVGYAHA